MRDDFGQFAHSLPHLSVPGGVEQCREALHQVDVGVGVPACTGREPVDIPALIIPPAASVMCSSIHRFEATRGLFERVPYPEDATIGGQRVDGEGLCVEQLLRVHDSASAVYPVIEF